MTSTKNGGKGKEGDIKCNFIKCNFMVDHEIPHRKGDFLV